MLAPVCILRRGHLPIQQCHGDQVGQTVVSLFFGVYMALVSLLASAETGMGRGLRTIQLPDAESYLAALAKGENILGPTPERTLPPLPTNRDELSDWFDLWDPRFAGHTGMYGMESTGGLEMLMSVARQLSGDYRKMDAAFAKFKELDKSSTKFTFAFSASAGKQVPEQFEGGVKDTLTTAILGAGAEQTGLSATETVFTQEPLEIKAKY